MELELFDALRSAGVQEDRARVAVDAFGRALDRRDERFVSRIDQADFKAEVAREFALVRADIAKLCGEFAELRGEVAELRAEIAGLRAETRSAMAELKSDLVRWVSALFIAQSVAVGVLVKLLH